MKGRSVLALIVIVLAGCATQSWKYGGVTYPTSTDALEAARRDISSNVSAVEALSNTVGSSVVVYVPTVGAAEKGVQVAGNASFEQVRYVASTLHLGWHGMADSLKRRNIFRRVDVREFDQSRPYGAQDADYVIWLELNSPESVRWWISTSRSMDNAQAIALSPVSDSRGRIGGWLSSVEQYVRTHN